MVAPMLKVIVMGMGMAMAIIMVLLPLPYAPTLANIPPYHIPKLI